MSSSRAKHWAWSQLDLSPSELLILLAMADNVGETLICYASLATIGEMARQSERTVQRNLARLEAMGKISRVVRPGRTTLFQLLVPQDFGKTTGRRKAGRTHDKLAGAGETDGAEATHDNVSGEGDDKMTGVEPTTDWRGPPSNRRGTHDNLSPDSSLDPSLHSPQARASAGSDSSPARTRALRAEERELVLLKNSAANLRIHPMTENETIAHFRRRVEEATLRDLEARQRKRLGAGEQEIH